MDFIFRYRMACAVPACSSFRRVSANRSTGTTSAPASGCFWIKAVSSSGSYPAYTVYCLATPRTVGPQ